MSDNFAVFTVRRNEQVVQGIPIGRLNNLEGRIAYIEKHGSGGSGGSLTVLTPTGTINGSNTSFTLSSSPIAIVIDNTTVLFNGVGYTYSGTTISITDSTYAPQSSILAFVATGGSSILLAATGTVNGSNTSFTFPSAPDVIYVDNIPKQKVSSDGTVNWTGTTTVSLTIAPNFDIFGYGAAGGTSSYQTATGTVNGSNATFSFANAPNVLSVDNIPLQKVSSDGTVNWTGTTTIVLSTAPNFDIFGIA